MTRKQAALAVGIGLSALFLYLAVRDLDGRELLESLAAANPVWAVPFVLSLGVFCWLKSIRWARLLRPVAACTGSQLLSPVIIGYMGTGLMPMQLGELARAYVAALKIRARVAPVLASLFVERLLDAFVLFVILGLIGLTRGELEPAYRVAALLSLGVAAATLVVSWIYAVHTERVVSMVESAAASLPGRWRHFLVDHLRAGAAGMHVLRRPSELLGLMSISLLQWVFMCGCVWISLAAIGHYMSVAPVLTVLATTVLAMMLPAGPGYVGALQLAFVIALTPFGIARSDALAASVFYLAAIWIPLVGGGLVLLHRMGMGFKDLREERLTREAPALVGAGAGEAADSDAERR